LDRYARRFSRRMFATVGLILIVVGSALALLVVRPDVPPWLGILSWGIAGLGMGMTYTTLSLVTLELDPKGQEGVSSAALQLTDSLGVAIGTGVGGAFVAAYGAGNTHLAIETHYVLMIGVAMLALVTARGLATRGATAAASAEA
ncbi:MAG TPA: MFS transporter, partial [Roseiflexaceae bacterium]|nr:MFS transporter [Roseiflexaceae bacterium]